MTIRISIEPTQLPPTIREYLIAHAAGDADTAARSFAPDAVVTDEGRTFRGAAQVVDFLRNAGSEYTYTTELVGAERIDDTHWVARVRLEGDFPGGDANLAYRFTLAEGLITGLVIAP